MAEIFASGGAEPWLATAPALAAHQQFGEISYRRRARAQSSGAEHAGEVVHGIAAVIGLVKAGRKALDEAVPGRPVAHLQAIEEDEQAISSKDTGNLARHLPAHIGRQLVVEKDARDDVGAGIGQRHLLGRSSYQLSAA